MIWADLVGSAWADSERAYLGLTARTIERAPALMALIGAGVDSERLAQRLADASVIAGRMAHDFDNILTGIIGFSDLTMPLLQPGSQAANFVAEISKVGQRGIVFTQQLHQLSRSGQTKPSPGAVSNVLAREEVRLMSAMSPGLRVEYELPPNLPTVAVDAAPLQSALGHLFENAVEACPQGGVVRIAAKAVELTDADAKAFLGRLGAGSHLMITISDTGTGIKPEVRRRLFVEPFFTTKVRHRGLGLAIAYRILCAHRGGIQIDQVPAPGVGTQVRVVLPLATARPPGGPGSPGGHPATGGTISATAVGG